MIHTCEYQFDSPDQACTVFCVIEYEAEAATHHCGYTLGGQLYILSVKALRIEGYDLDGNDVYMLFSEDLSDGWAEALDLIADTTAREEMNDSTACLGDSLWENAGFLV